MAADCAACWAHTEPGAGPAGSQALDWIVPAAADAPLAGAALAEARERLARRERGARSPALAPAAGAALKVGGGPALYGYLGARVDARGRWPRGSSAWLALVEEVPAGASGNGSPRVLVRAATGPLPLPGPHLHALRLPPGVPVQRLAPRAWVEDALGHIVAFASPDCLPP